MFVIYTYVTNQSIIIHYISSFLLLCYYCLMRWYRGCYVFLLGKSFFINYHLILNMPKDISVFLPLKHQHAQAFIDGMVFESSHGANSIDLLNI